MPYPKLKEESYANLGGMDTKASEYITDQLEFLNLRNTDFRVLGSLSSFCGSTAFNVVNSTLPIYGVSDYYTVSYDATGGGGYINTSIPTYIGVDQENVCDITGKTFVPLLHSRVAGGVINPTSFVLTRQLFGCNGVDAWRYAGSTMAYQFSLGKPVYGGGATNSSTGATTTGISGVVVFYHALVRNDGFVGPAKAATYTAAGALYVSATVPSSPNLKMAFTGGPNVPGVGANSSLGTFDLAGVQTWASVNGGPFYAFPLLDGITTGGFPGQTLPFNYTSAWSPASSYIYGEPVDYQGAFMYGLGSTQGGDNAQATGSNPNIQEYHYNQLFSAGFGSSFASRVVFSNPGTPEKSDYRNFFDVAPNDPNGVSAMKSYFTQLGIWKPSSSWSLSGTGPDTFNLIQVSSIYGCISKLAVCVWNQNCWFLDKQGICEFNGSNTQIVSTKLQDIFDRMNLTAASRLATMVHVKHRNEVWTAIPIDGSEYNNIIVVFDYIAKAWYTADVPAGGLTYNTVLGLGDDRPVPYYGTSTGLVGNWGSSFIGDNGTGITYVIKTRFLSDLGNTTTKMFRRLFLDAKVPTGQTQTFYLNFYRDHQETAYYSTTMSISSDDVQQRIDFGVPGKAMSVEMFYLGEGGPLEMGGFGVAYRYQRDV